VPGWRPPEHAASNCVLHTAPCYEGREAAKSICSFLNE